MAIVEIVESLYAEIEKKFKGGCVEVFEHIKSLGSSPHKGKVLGSVGGVVIKELKYKGFRFYFITDGHKIKFFDQSHLANLLLLFVRMSDKKKQQKVINEIKQILINLDPDGFE